jgi:hypothetical protein
MAIKQLPTIPTEKVSTFFCCIIDMNLVTMCHHSHNDSSFDGLTLRGDTSFSVFCTRKIFMRIKSSQREDMYHFCVVKAVTCFLK